MEVDVAPKDIEAETRNVEALAVEPGSLLRGAISACRPEDQGFPAFLERALADPFVKGFRRLLHEVPDDLSERPLFRENLRRLSGTGRPFDLCVRPDQIEKAIALADVSPQVQFVLDHCGAQFTTPHLLPLWRDKIAEIAKRPNVAVKISGVVAYMDKDAGPSTTSVPMSRAPSRASAGTGSHVWPVSTPCASLSTWVAATHALTLGASESERERLFTANADRIWRL